MAPPPVRESFFKILNDLRVLFGVPRPRSDVSKAEFLEDTANRNLVEIDVKTFLDDAPEVGAPPAHHAIPGGIGTSFHDR